MATLEKNISARNLRLLVSVPIGINIGLAMLERDEGNGFVGMAGVALWSVGFLVASVVACEYPRIAASLAFIVSVCSPVFLEGSIIVRSVHVLASVTHGLRLSALIGDRAKFAKTSPQYRIVYTHFYHDLTQAEPCWDVKRLLTEMLLQVGLDIGLIAAALFVHVNADIGGENDIWVTRTPSAFLKQIIGMVSCDTIGKSSDFK